ncbi:FMN reductase (NADH) RutF [uncultured archaeon]|nr:FMN reductase (NADH) RutF [uncultured archaeon]
MPKISVQKPTRLIHHNPVCLVTSKSDTVENVFTASWVMPVSNNPPMVALSVAKSRFSYGLIKKSGAFVLNIPNKSMLKEVIYCGSVSGRDKNKFAEMKFQKEMSPHANILLSKCIAYLECKVTKEIEVSDRTIFIAEIIANGVQKGLFENDKWILSEKSEILLYLGDGKYCTVRPV